MKDLAENQGRTLGLGMALTQNVDAMNYFSSLTDSEKQAVIDGSRSLHSNQAMQAYVQHFTDWRLAKPN